jgi:surface carbohydrate biosynthesis protein
MSGQMTMTIALESSREARTLFLMVESAHRELDARLLLTRQALDAGYRVVIGQQWLLNEYLPAFAPGVVVFKGINRIQGNWMKRAREYGHRVVAVNEEAMALCSKLSIALETTQEIFEQIDRLCAQGDNERDAYLEYFSDVAERISVTGNGRVELLSLRHRHRQFKARDAIRREHGRFILVNTNYGYINTEFGMPEDFIRHVIRVGVLNPTNQCEVDMYRDRFAFEQKNMKAFWEMIPALRLRYPGHLVVLRPHPSENHERWRRLVGKIPGVLIAGEGALVPWILASDILIHNTCTTGLEAMLLKHPVVAYCPFTNAYEAELTPNFVTPRVETFDALTDAIDAALANPRGTTERQAQAAESMVLQHYAEAFEGEATGRILAQIEEVAGDLPSEELLRSGASLDPTAPYPEEQKSRISLTKNELIARFLRVNQGDTTSSSFQVENLGESLFVMCRRQHFIRNRVD